MLRNAYPEKKEEPLKYVFGQLAASCKSCGLKDVKELKMLKFS